MWIKKTLILLRTGRVITKNKLSLLLEYQKLDIVATLNGKDALMLLPDASEKL